MRTAVVLGLRGLPRRYVDYPGGVGFDTPNLVSTIGAGILAVLAVGATMLGSRRARNTDADPRRSTYLAGPSGASFSISAVFWPGQHQYP